MRSATTNIHIYPSPFINESRILKITKSLSDAAVFERIIIFATWEEKLSPQEQIDDRREVSRIRRNLGGKTGGFLAKVAKTLEWSWKIFRRVRSIEVVCINCHSLPVLPLGVFLKRVKKGKLIYDTHELETETVGLSGIRKRAMKALEKRLLPFVDEVCVVNESIADWYRKEYGLDQVQVVKNVPYRDFSQPSETVPITFRDLFRIPPAHSIFLYQGAISGDRGVNLLLKIFSKVDRSKHIIFMGFGDMVEAVQSYSEDYPNIHYHPAVNPDKVREYTAAADVGIHLIENSCLNHYYCLPNKIWEYLNSGIPVLVTDLYEMGKVVDRYQCGWKCPAEEETALRLIDQLTAEEIGRKKIFAAQSKEHFGWDLEEPSLLAMYQRLGFAADNDQRRPAGERPDKN